MGLEQREVKSPSHKILLTDISSMAVYHYVGLSLFFAVESRSDGLAYGFAKSK